MIKGTLTLITFDLCGLEDSEDLTFSVDVSVGY